MNLVLERETPPLHEDETGAVRIGSSRVLLEIVQLDMSSIRTCLLSQQNL
jgi:hypothetical protein